MYQKTIGNIPPDLRFHRNDTVVNLKNLNSAQYAAATHGEGPLLVLAGAGTGKTRTLVYRMAYLLEQGIPPESILLLTFTNLAASEMVRRAVSLAGTAAVIQGGTFHSFAVRYLRKYASVIGYSAGFSIIDTSQQESIIKLLRKSIDTDLRLPNARQLLRIISAAHNKGLWIEGYVCKFCPQYIPLIGVLSALEDRYSGFKFDHNHMDFDDLLSNFLLILRSDFGKRIKYQYILVDEYQDTNAEQAEIVRLLGDHQNVMAVGDPDQSVYGFRGADVENIRQFSAQFPGCAVVDLEENYRSVNSVLEFSNKIIEKKLYSSLGPGEPVFAAVAENEAQEAAFVAARVQDQLKAGVAPGEIAVLYRSSYHADKVDLALSVAGIPFDKRGGVRLVDSFHVRDFLSFYRVLSNPFDKIAWLRILNMLPKVGPATAGKVFAFLAKQDKPVLSGYPAGKAWAKPFALLVDLFTQLQEVQDPGRLWELISAYYSPYFRGRFEDYPKRQLDFDRLQEVAESFCSVGAFLDSLALDQPTEEKQEGVILSTVHRAKGLEFDTVFVIGASEGRFNAFPGDPVQNAEDRRLFYVACTRAKQRLFVICPENVMSADRRFIKTRPLSFLSFSDRGSNW